MGTVGYLFVFHSYLLHKGRTSVEQRCCKGEKPGCNHDNGWAANWTEVCGPFVCTIAFLLPLPPSAYLCCTPDFRKADEARKQLYSDHSLMARARAAERGAAPWRAALLDRRSVPTEPRAAHGCATHARCGPRPPPLPRARSCLLQAQYYRTRLAKRAVNTEGTP